MSLDYRSINIFFSLKQNLRDLSSGSQKRGRCKRNGYLNSGRKRGEKRWSRWGNGGSRRRSNNGDREQVAATESGECSVSLYGLWLRHIMALPFSCLIFFINLNIHYALCNQTTHFTVISNEFFFFWLFVYIKKKQQNKHLLLQPKFW